MLYSSVINVRFITGNRAKHAKAGLNQISNMQVILSDMNLGALASHMSRSRRSSFLAAHSFAYEPRCATDAARALHPTFQI